MYSSRSNPQRGLAIWCWTGDEASVEEWQRHIKDMQEVSEWTHLRHRPSVIIYMANMFMPNAIHRKDIARFSANPNYQPNLAVVTKNQMIRGVIRVFGWLQSRQPYRIAPFERLTDAMLWLEQDRGSPLPDLLELLKEAHEELGISPLIVSRTLEELERERPAAYPAA